MDRNPQPEKPVNLTPAQRRAVVEHLRDHIHDLEVDREVMADEVGFDIVQALTDLTDDLEQKPAPKLPPLIYTGTFETLGEPYEIRLDDEHGHVKLYLGSSLEMARQVRDYFMERVTVTIALEG
jgi:hypothetical protein